MSFEDLGLAETLLRAVTSGRVRSLNVHAHRVQRTLHRNGIAERCAFGAGMCCARRTLQRQRVVSAWSAGRARWRAVGGSGRFGIRRERHGNEGRGPGNERGESERDVAVRRVGVLAGERVVAREERRQVRGGPDEVDGTDDEEDDIYDDEDDGQRANLWHGSPRYRCGAVTRSGPRGRVSGDRCHASAARVKATRRKRSESHCAVATNLTER